MILRLGGVVKVSDDPTRIAQLKAAGYEEYKPDIKQEKAAKPFDINTAKAGELLAYAAELGEGYEEIAALPKNSGAEKIREALSVKIAELKGTE